MSKAYKRTFKSDKKLFYKGFVTCLGIDCNGKKFYSPDRRNNRICKFCSRHLKGVVDIEESIGVKGRNKDENRKRFA
jgi:hypothetical protein